MTLAEQMRITAKAAENKARGDYRRDKSQPAHGGRAAFGSMLLYV